MRTLLVTLALLTACGGASAPDSTQPTPDTQPASSETGAAGAGTPIAEASPAMSAGEPTTLAKQHELPTLAPTDAGDPPAELMPVVDASEPATAVADAGMPMVAPTAAADAGEPTAAPVTVPDASTPDAGDAMSCPRFGAGFDTTGTCCLGQIGCHVCEQARAETTIATVSCVTYQATGCDEQAYTCDGFDSAGHCVADPSTHVAHTFIYLPCQ